MQQKPLPDWHFILDRGVNFRTKKALLTVGFPCVLQLADIGLTGLAKDIEIFRAAQQQHLILITKDTDFLVHVTYAIGHYGILYIAQSKSEVEDTVTGILNLAQQFTSLTNMRWSILIGGQLRQQF